MTLLKSMTPYFEVFDMTASLAFYQRLGFELLFASPEVETAEGRFSHYVRLGRDGFDLMLNTAYDANERPPGRTDARWAGCRHVALYLDCEDVERLFAELSARGLQAKAPAKTGYGYLAFSAQDPDGYRIVFQTPLPNTPENP
jgi:glyoxylase I family protein